MQTAMTAQLVTDDVFIIRRCPGADDSVANLRLRAERHLLRQTEEAAN